MTDATMTPGTEPWREQYETQLRMWSRGFQACYDWLQPQLDRANADADRLWYELRNPEEARRQHAEMLRAFDVVRNRQSTAARWAELDRIAAERSRVTA